MEDDMLRGVAGNNGMLDGSINEDGDVNIVRILSVARRRRYCVGRIANGRIAS